MKMRRCKGERGTGEGKEKRERCEDVKGRKGIKGKEGVKSKRKVGYKEYWEA